MFHNTFLNINILRSTDVLLHFSMNYKNSYGTIVNNSEKRRVACICSDSNPYLDCRTS